MTDKIVKVPNLAPTSTDKVLRERHEMELERPSAPVTYTPNGMQVTKREGDRLEIEPVTTNDLAVASGIIRDPYNTKVEVDNRHVTDKIYMNSEEFNELRRRLYEQHNDIFERIGGLMVFDAPKFVAAMNAWLHTDVQFDSWNEAGICRQFLKALDYKSRGLPADLAVTKVPKIILPGDFN